VAVLETPEEIAAALTDLPVEEVWGIGSRRGQFLRQHDIATAYAFTQADLGWVRRHLSVVGARTQLELRGISCLPLDPPRTHKQQLCCSRAFGQPITTREEMRQAVAQYTSWVAEKLRKQDSVALRLTVFVTTNPFRTQTRQYRNSRTISLGQATSDTATLMAAAQRALERIWRDGYSYHKAGVLLHHLGPDSPRQMSLFEPEPTNEPLMQVIDAINCRFGRDILRFGATGLVQPWRMRQAFRSRRATTRWNELAHVH
jgi:DNA polymerase V